MKISIVGTGAVGSLTTQYLMQEDLGDIYLINRNKEKSTGVLLDTVSAYPTKHLKLHVGSFKDIKSSDIVVITAGPIAKANQSFEELSIEGLRTIKEIADQSSFNKNSVVILTTAPVDENAQFFQEYTDHPREKVIGFGGSLDTSRLKYLLSKETGKPADGIDCTFISIHGGRGIPIFRENVKNKNEIVRMSKEYFKEVASRTKGSTSLGPAKQLADLVQVVAEDRKEVVGISTWSSEHKLFITWPTVVGKNGVLKLKKLELDNHEKKELKMILSGEQKRRESLFQQANN